MPKLREGTYFPDWLLERRRRAESALVCVVATSYLLGVSARGGWRSWSRQLGITRLSKSQVSEMAKDLDGQVEAFRTRPLDAGPYTFVAADALVLKVREGGRTVNVHALLATGVNADGYREILGLHVTSAEDGAGWLGFFRDLTARGLTGVALVTSDAHRGLVEAIGATLPGAAWQRCRTHYAANLMSATPKSAWGWVKALLHSVYDQPDADAVHAQFDRILDALADKLPAVATHLDAARADILAFTAFPRRLAADLVQQPPGTAEPGDPPPHRRRRHLPRPDRPDPAGRRRPGRAARRMDRATPLPRPRHPCQEPPHQDHRREPDDRGGDHHRHHRIESKPRSRGDRIKHHSSGRDPIRPPPRLVIPARTAREQRNVPKRLISMSRHQSSAATSQTGPSGGITAALFTRRSTDPASRSTASINCCTAPGLETSIANGAAWPPESLMRRTVCIELVRATCSDGNVDTLGGQPTGDFTSQSSSAPGHNGSLAQQSGTLRRDSRSGPFSHLANQEATVPRTCRHVRVVPVAHQPAEEATGLESSSVCLEAPDA